MPYEVNPVITNSDVTLKDIYNVNPAYRDIFSQPLYQNDLLLTRNRNVFEALYPKDNYQNIGIEAFANRTIKLNFDTKVQGTYRVEFINGKRTMVYRYTKTINTNSTCFCKR